MAAAHEGEERKSQETAVAFVLRGPQEVEAADRGRCVRTKGIPLWREEPGTFGGRSRPGTGTRGGRGGSKAMQAT